MKIISALIAVISLLILSCTSTSEPSDDGAYMKVLTESQKSIDSAISALFADIQTACKNIAATKQDEVKIREELVSILLKHKTATEAVYVNSENIIAHIEPEEYRYAEGSDITEQEHQQKMVATHDGAVSGIFKVVEGYYAIVIAYPIIVNGKMEGSVNIVIKPYNMISSFSLAHLQNPADGKYLVDAFWVMETNGMILYDIDSTQVGKNSFTDSLFIAFPEIKIAADRINAGDAGKTNYSFLDASKQKTVTKDVWWSTSNYKDKIWKFCVSKERR